MSGWFNSTTINISGSLPVAKVYSKSKNLRLRGARWTQCSTAASSGGAIGACLLKYGGTTANVTSTPVGHGSSLTAPTVHEIIDDGGILSAHAILATFGTGSSVCGPLTVTIWGDYDD